MIRRAKSTPAKAIANASVNGSGFVAMAAISATVCAALFSSSISSAIAADILDPTPISQQETPIATGAVDGVNATFGVLGGSLDGVANGMVLASFSTAVPYLSSFGVQGDLAYGVYDGTTASSSAAAALHIFWRNPGTGMIGVYGDWGYLSPVHSGRLGVEGSLYSGQWSVDAFLGMEFGQNVLTKFVDEIDVSYYADENLRFSFGHRLHARGHMGSVGFEKLIGTGAGSAWSVYGEAEFGEDDYYQAFVGLKAYLGTSNSQTLMQRDRYDNVRVRIPRNLSAITQCGNVDTPFAADKWLTDWHLIKEGSQTETLCGATKDINAYSSTGIFKP